MSSSYIYIVVPVSTEVVCWKYVHCPKNSPGFCVYAYLVQKQDIYHCICSNHDKSGLYAEIQIIFGTVYPMASYGGGVFIF